jgi:hypothetical protein
MSLFVTDANTLIHFRTFKCPRCVYEIKIVRLPDRSLRLARLHAQVEVNERLDSCSGSVCGQFTDLAGSLVYVLETIKRLEM